ncbi:hypothetical protein [Pandoravirus japonicus]|uniref:Uncharacterized protein n=1 Tax=Pandoravirus japonicus TaxID=2823154 RepID=A0A811BP89_9VIRU|nr:hypothetical protein [Pandoravirus japonicus]
MPHTGADGTRDKANLVGWLLRLAPGRLVHGDGAPQARDMRADDAVDRSDKAQYGVDQFGGKVVDGRGQCLRRAPACTLAPFGSLLPRCSAAPTTGSFLSLIFSFLQFVPWCDGCFGPMTAG